MSRMCPNSRSIKVARSNKRIRVWPHSFFQKAVDVRHKLYNYLDIWQFPWKSLIEESILNKIGWSRIQLNFLEPGKTHRSQGRMYDTLKFVTFQNQFKPPRSMFSISQCNFCVWVFSYHNVVITKDVNLECRLFVNSCSVYLDISNAFQILLNSLLKSALCFVGLQRPKIRRLWPIIATNN